MFGKSQSNNGFTPPAPPKASDVARLEGGGLVLVVVTSVAPLTFSLFLNDRPVSQMDVESLDVFIDAPDDGMGQPTVRATLARRVTSVIGETTMQRTELFPCTVEILAAGRLIAVTASEPNTLDGVVIRLGLRADGTSSDVSGAKTLRILMTDNILDAKLTWVDGETEDLLPQ